MVLSVSEQQLVPLVVWEVATLTFPPPPPHEFKASIPLNYFKPATN
jgi:hypothetical protein